MSPDDSQPEGDLQLIDDLSLEENELNVLLPVLGDVLDLLPGNNFVAHADEVEEDDDEEDEENYEKEVIMAGAQALTAMALRPSSFNGLHPEMAQQWWTTFTRYNQLAGIEEDQRQNLLGLLLSGTALLWFDSIPEATKRDFQRLEAAFREKWIIAGPNGIQRQMQTLARTQQPGESVDEYVADSRSKMGPYNYDDALKMTLILNGLRPEIKAVVMQHMPFNNIDVLATKAKHVEVALKLYLQTNLQPAVVKTVNVSAARQDTLDMGEVRKAIEEAMEPLSIELAAIIDQVRSENVTESQRQNGRSRRRQGFDGVTRPSSVTETRCLECGSVFHMLRDCPHMNGGRQHPQDGQRCYECNSSYHLRSSCPRLRSDNQQYREQQHEHQMGRYDNSPRF